MIIDIDCDGVRLGDELVLHILDNGEHATVFRLVISVGERDGGSTKQDRGYQEDDAKFHGDLAEEFDSPRCLSQLGNLCPDAQLSLRDLRQVDAPVRQTLGAIAYRLRWGSVIVSCVAPGKGRGNGDSNHCE